MDNTNPPDDFHPSTNPFGLLTEFALQVKGTNPTLGLDLIKDPDKYQIMMRLCTLSSPSTRITRWRYTLCNSCVIIINNISIESTKQFASIITKSRADKVASLLFTVVPPKHVNIKPDTNIPHIYFDQINVMIHQCHADKYSTSLWYDPQNPLPANDSAVFAAVYRGNIKPHLTCSFLKRQADWMDWALSEF